MRGFSKKDFQTAVSEFQKLADQQPESYRIQYMLGASLQRLNRKEEALNHLNKAYDLNPNELSVKLELGKAYFSVRRYQETVKLLDTTSVRNQARSGTCWSFAANSFIETELLRLSKGTHDLSEMFAYRGKQYTPRERATFLRNHAGGHTVQAYPVESPARSRGRGSLHVRVMLRGVGPATAPSQSASTDRSRRSFLRP